MSGQLTYVGPNLDAGLGVLPGGSGYYLLDGITLPTGTVKGLDYYVDRTAGWNQFDLIIFRPVGVPATTTQYEIVGIYSVTAQPSVVTGITGENFTSADYINVVAGDHICVYSDFLEIPVTSQFDNNFILNTRFSVLLNPPPTIGNIETFDRVGLGPQYLSLRVLVDESTRTVTTCQGGGNSVCDQLCTDDVNGYYCSCAAFYELNPADNATCVPVQRTCANFGDSHCSHNCSDTITGYECSCLPGFTLQSNGYSCVDNDLNAFIGEQGMTGVKGERGLQGSKGQKGVAGATGPIGQQGATGLQGIKGAVGATGLVGLTGPEGATGIQGITGAQGPKGVDGSVGPAGPMGAVGAIGVTGATGPQGLNGLNGTTGPKGEKGDTGETGPSGTNGIPGVQGVAGQAGPVGAKGSEGPEGATGIKGAVGDTGPEGDTGLQGPAFQDDDECRNASICAHNCVNTVGSYYCTCNAGYNLINDNSTCVESLECRVQNGGCQHTCGERTGGYVCSCNSGYDLGPDRHSCIDQNECSNSTQGGCASNEVCINTPGASICVPSTVDNAALLACTNAAAQNEKSKCEYSSGLVSGNTIIGFIVWLVLLTLLVLGIFGCVLCINSNKGGMSSYDRSEIYEDKSRTGTIPTRYSSIRTALPETNYTYY